MALQAQRAPRELARLVPRDRQAHKALRVHRDWAKLAQLAQPVWQVQLGQRAQRALKVQQGRKAMLAPRG
jgi:hypothetical protein